MPPEISAVIILTAWGDSERESVESVLAQDIHRPEMEIIVVRNFSNSSMEDYFSRNNIISIFTREETLGAMISQGIDGSSAPVITFLEGGDLFTTDRARVVRDIFNDEDRLLYHHSAVKPSDLPGSQGRQFTSMDFDLMVGHDDVPFAFPLIMRHHGITFVSAVSCRTSAVRKNSNLIHNIHTSADIAILLSCLESMGRFVFDKDERAVCRVAKYDPASVTEDEIIRNEIEYNLQRIEDVEKIGYTLKQQRTIDIIKVEKTYSTLIVSFLTDDREQKLGIGKLLYYLLVGAMERHRVILRWTRANLSAKFRPANARRKYLSRILENPWEYRL